MSELAEWSSFYVIVGSAAGALVGLQFVVMTLVTNKPMRGIAEAGAAFATPSVVHFCVVLLLSAVANAPWYTIRVVAVFWGLIGLGGAVYELIVMRRLKMQTAYRPVFYDWFFHVLLPFAAYAILAGSAYAARSHARPALFVLGAGVLILLFTGIHNAWDAVTYHIFIHKGKQD